MSEVPISRVQCGELAQCDYCGRAITKRHRLTKRDGQNYHRACWLELLYPDDPKVGHDRHDIHDGGT